MRQNQSNIITYNLLIQKFIKLKMKFCMTSIFTKEQRKGQKWGEKERDNYFYFTLCLVTVEER